MIFRHARPAHFIFLILIVAGILAPAPLLSELTATRDVFSEYGARFTLLAFFFFLGFCLFLVFSRFGRIRLGASEERPEFSLFSWVAMLFAAGMGTGLVFHGAAEPLLHFASPPPGTPAGADNARAAMTITYFHWGLHAWTAYAVAGLAIAYFSFRKNAPFLPSAPLTSFFAPPYRRVIAESVDTLGIIAIVFGVVASLGKGVLQMDSGLDRLGFNPGDDHSGPMLILGMLVLGYLISAATGIKKGIRLLSDVNILLALALLLFILVYGPPVHISTLWHGIIDYLREFVSLSLTTRIEARGGGSWMRDWTITYLLWWIAWAPFVGIFIARISRGRTIREFILGVVFVPVCLSFVWFAALGGSALYFHRKLEAAALSDLSSVAFAMLDMLPHSGATSIALILLIFLFLITSADSASYVLGMLTSSGKERPPKSQRIFWGGVLGVTTALILLQKEQIALLHAVAMVGAIPYLCIMLFQCFALWKALREEQLP